MLQTNCTLESTVSIRSLMSLIKKYNFTDMVLRNSAASFFLSDDSNAPGWGPAFVCCYSHDTKPSSKSCSIRCGVTTSAALNGAGSFGIGPCVHCLARICSRSPCSHGCTLACSGSPFSRDSIRACSRSPFSRDSIRACSSMA
jgi:hypothetical protein